MCVGIGSSFLGAVELTGEVRYLLVARTTAWQKAGKRMKSPPRCLYCRSSFCGARALGFPAGGFVFGRSLQLATNRA
jgi:hypothetical protein